jgi:predicted kinase
VTPRLVHLNGPSAVGKSTVARLLVAERPFALALDIDMIRVALGQWASHDRTKAVARARGFEMAAAHLGDGYDVVLPQLVARLDVVEHLERLADDAGAALVEVMLLAPRDELLRRFASRRAGPHPGDTVTVADAAALLDDTLMRMHSIVEARSATIVVESTTPEATAERIITLVGW